MSTQPATGVGPNNKLRPCPASPNCVCSSYPQDESHFTEPFVYVDSQESARQRLLRILEEDRRATIKVATDTYIHATFRAFIFTDDVEFHFPTDRDVVEVRSASRVGYGDFGANRRRINKLRSKFERHV